MKKDKRERLKSAGWTVGNAKQFLGLSDADSALIDVRIKLAKALRRRRVAQKLSQVELAEQLGSSQSRVAKMEAGDPSVSLDLLIHSLYASGSTGAEIGRAFASVA